MTKLVYDAIKETLNCMKGSGIKQFTVNDVVDKCYSLFYSDTDWKPSVDTIKNQLVQFKQNENRAWCQSKIIACGKQGRQDLLTWNR